MNSKRLQYAAIIAMISAGIIFIYNLVTYIQTIYSLQTPLISSGFIKMIAELPLRLSILSAIILVASFILYRFKKYILIVLLCIGLVLFLLYFPDLLL